MAPVVAYLRTKRIKIFLYINDWLLVANTYQCTVDATNTTLRVLHNLGLQINQEKSNLVPSQHMSYIGAQLDSSQAIALLSQDKIATTGRALQNFQPLATLTVPDTQHLLGLMASTTSVVPHARLKLRTILAPLPTRPFNRHTTKEAKGTAVCGTPTYLVDSRSQPPNWQSIHTSVSLYSGNNRLQPLGMGSSLPRASGTWFMVRKGKNPSHKSTGTVGHHKSLLLIPPQARRKSSTIPDRQHHRHVLYKPARRNPITTPPSPHHRLLGMVLHPRYIPSGDPYLIRRQLPGRSPKQVPHQDARMVTQ
ncbi:uncharacterized protein LOC144589516 [Pogona vitticeps]